MLCQISIFDHNYLQSCIKLESSDHTFPSLLEFDLFGRIKKCPVEHLILKVIEIKVYVYSFSKERQAYVVICEIKLCMVKR